MTLLLDVVPPRTQQLILNQWGYDLKVDNQKGPKTERAVIGLKRGLGLTARPWWGPQTHALATKHINIPQLAVDTGAPEKLRPLVQPDDVYPPWYDEMLKYLGTHESDPRYKIWLKSDGPWVGDPEDFPHCADAVGTALGNTLPGMTYPENSFLAKNWTTWGKGLSEPCIGAIMVQFNYTEADHRGHIYFYAGESETHYYGLGCNQSNRCSIRPFLKWRIRRNGIRWPDHPAAPAPNGVRPRMSGGTILTPAQTL